MHFAQYAEEVAELRRVHMSMDSQHVFDLLAGLVNRGRQKRGWKHELMRKRVAGNRVERCFPSEPLPEVQIAITFNELFYSTPRR